MIKKLGAAGLVAASLITATAAGSLLAFAKDNGKGHAREASVEVRISENGRVRVNSAKVTGTSGDTVSAVTTFGSNSLNWSVLTDGNTQIECRSEGRCAFSDIAVGDMINFRGMLTGASGNQLSVKADQINDFSSQIQRAAFTGVVQTVDTANRSFTLKTEEHGTISVMVTSTAQIVKSDGTVAAFSDIAVGLKVTVRGTFDPAQNKLTAEFVRIHIFPLRTTIEGTLKSVASTTLPTTLVLTSDGRDFTVNLASDTSILNVFFLRVPLSSFRVGDHVRVFGSVNIVTAVVDATVIRDTNLR